MITQIASNGRRAVIENPRHWTPDRVETLGRLWTEGKSASEIAKALGGITRNSVIGKIHRMGLPHRATDVHHRSAAQSRGAAKSFLTNRPRKTARPSAPTTDRKRVPGVHLPPMPIVEQPSTIAPQALPDGSFATVQTVTDQMCKWAYGEPDSASVHFCGRDKERGPYCAAHAAHVYVPIRKKSERMASARRRSGIDGDELRFALRVAQGF